MRKTRLQRACSAAGYSIFATIVAPLKDLWVFANERSLGIRTVAQKQKAERKPGWWRGEPCDRARYNDNFLYATIDYFNARKLIAALHPGPEDVFYDIGCGMGRILCLMARVPVKKCVGIELLEPLCEIARRNASTLRGRKTPIEIVCQDAARADLSDGTIYFMFNPFGEQTLRDTLKNITESIQAKPRSVLLVYYNPTCQHVLEHSAFFRKTRELRINGSHVVTLWKNARPVTAAVAERHDPRFR